jgi:hypothetical protein
MKRYVGAFTVTTLVTLLFLIIQFVTAVIVQQMPGHSDPLCGRDCYPVQS